MGAWATGAYENDGAQDWLISEVRKPVARAIREALNKYIAAKPKTQANVPDEAEAAAQLLVNLTLETRVVDLRYDAGERPEASCSLYGLALQALDKILADEEYLSRWREPDMKRNALMYLRASVVYAQDKEHFERSMFRVERGKAKRVTRISKRRHTKKAVAVKGK